MTPRPLRILELRSVRGTGGGPEKTILLGAARSDPARYAVTVCYIRDERDRVFEINRRAAELGVDYLEIGERHSFDVSIWRRLRRVVRDRRIRIIHAHDYKTDLYAWLLAKAEPVVAITTVHGYTGHSWKERIYYAADRRLVGRLAAVIAVSGQLRDEVIRYGASPGRVTRVLNGIDHEAFRRDPGLREPARAALGLRPGDLVIGSVGRLERQKRFDLLIEAFAEIRRRMGPAARLVIAGDGSLKEALQAQVRALGLEEACLLCGHRNDVARLHHAFDLFVQSSDYEGTPNAVLEAMAFETPLVATDAGGTAELVEDGVHGLIVAPGDAPALAAAIQRAIDDPAGAAGRAAAARRRIETDLSFQARMAAVERIYDSVAGLPDGA